MSTTEWWRGSVTYQIYPRSFQDSNGDGVGDLPGITARLAHVAELGADAVWLSPVFTSPMVDMGYDIADHRDIDPSFGTLSDFDRLVTRAHDLGLKVIIDQVLNHTSDRHPFFTESRSSRDNPKADWYVWADPRPDGTPPNNWQSVFGGSAWQWDTRRYQYYLHNFMVAQPDLNFHKPAVQDWALDTLRFWLDRGVDGFRFDTVNFYFHDRLLRDDAADYRVKAKPAFKTYDMQYHLFSKNQPENLVFLARVRALMDSYGATTSVGEVGEDHHPLEMMGQYTSGGRLHMAYSFGMMGFDFTAAHFRDQITQFFAAAPDGWPCWAFSNHDVIRHVTRWQEFGPVEDVAKLSAALLLALEGSICLYQGEELGQTETDIEFHELTDPPGIRFWPEYKGRDGCRTPMVWDGSEQGGFTTGTPWLPVKAPQRQRNVAAQAGAPDSVLALYRNLLAWRKGSALRDGRSTFFDVAEPVLAFRRADAEGAVLCLFNLSDQAQSVPVSGVAVLDGPSMGATLADGQVTLAPCGWVWTRCDATVTAG